MTNYQQLLNNRYQIVKPLGRGGLGITYLANDLNTKQSVAIKILSLKRVSEWKKVELFEREAKVLAALNHPLIPEYIDYFQIENEQELNFYIAQKLAPGKSLDQWVETGWKPSVQEIKKLAADVLKILIYLQQLLPPIIHRDIKPQNIILDQNGGIFLVDFGSVQDTYRHSITQGSTVVGTFGYMAPEQFRGQAVLSTDLYGLGATLLYLITGISPAEFPQRNLKIKFRSALANSNWDESFIGWLERLLEPREKYRFSTAEEALNVLTGKEPLPPPPPEIIHKPEGSPIQINKNSDQLVIKIPAIGFRTPQIQRLAIANLIYNGFLLFVAIMMVSLQLFLAPSQFLSFGVLVVLGLYLLVKYIYGFLGTTKLIIDQLDNTIKLEQWLLGSCYRKLKLSLQNKDNKQQSFAKQVKVKYLKFWPWRKTPLTYCSLRINSTKCEFGSFLSTIEVEWLCQEIKTFLV